MIRDKAKRKLGRMAKSAAGKARARVQATHGPSPNPATNLILADIAMRGGGRLLRHTVERTLLGVKYNPSKARDIIAGRNMVQTLVGAAAARLATRSVPGALLVGGGLLAKTLYDRNKGRAAAGAEGEAKLEDMADNASEA